MECADALLQAVASMGSNDREPQSVMSRNKGDGKVVTGGRKIKHRQFPTVRRDTWPNTADEDVDVLGDGLTPPRSTKKLRTAKAKANKIGKQSSERAR